MRAIGTVPPSVPSLRQSSPDPSSAVRAEKNAVGSGCRTTEIGELIEIALIRVVPSRVPVGSPQ
jgi:hypothetical protein